MSESIESVLRKQIDTLHERLASQTERDGMEQANLRAQLDRARASEKRLAEALEMVRKGPAAGCGCVPKCQCWSQGALRTWAEIVMDDARAALSEMEGA